MDPQGQNPPIPDYGLAAPHEEENQHEEPPPAYPQNRAQFDGYQNLGFVGPDDSQKNANIPSDSNAPQPTFKDLPFLSEDDAKAALEMFVDQKCCYGKAPLKSLEFTNLKSSNSYRYILETFTESRSTKYVHEPYHNQPFFNNGIPPRPWDIPVSPTTLFADQIFKVEIPNTAHVETCYNCNGAGTKICTWCHGAGRRRCISCGGSGHKHVHHNTNGNHHHHNQTCMSCHGSGFTGCMTCSRTGRVVCRVCKRSGRLRWYLELTVEFKTYADDSIKKDEEIPDDKLRECLAKNIFSEQNVRLNPISNHSEADVNAASQRLIQSHLHRFANFRILAQRHDLNVIPITLCSYKFKNEEHKYHVYGLNNQVYCPEYPRKFLCCTIL